MHKKTFKITGMDCDSCAKMLELDLEDAGFNASCSYAECKLDVEIKEENDHHKIKEIVVKSGYGIS